MGRKKQIRNIVLVVVLSVSIILAGGIFYISNVQEALWKKSVTDILEVTEQGSHTLDTYIEKDMELLDWFSAELQEFSAEDEAMLLDRAQPPSNSKADYVCVNLDTGKAYTPLYQGSWTLNEEQLKTFSHLQGRGMREPFLNDYTGVWTIASYECFTFSDGTRGLVQKSRPLTEIAEGFSLSFYHDTGFSYVVNREGKILIRSQHPNSNRTIENLFDIINLQDNDTDAVNAFRQALQNGDRGVTRFLYQEEDYVFCYVPLQNAADWYVVSIVPNQVIMEQTYSIVQYSQIFFLLLLISVLAALVIFLIHRSVTQRILLAEEASRKAAESANLAKSRFLSNMSHDIRTPMNAVIGMTKLASDHINEPEKVAEYLKNIELSGQLLVGLINDILDMSKIESGKMTLNIDTASINDFLTNLTKIIQPNIEKKQQQFNISLHNIEHENLHFDVLRLNQMMINLLSNASKFTPEGGSINVDVTESPSAQENWAHYTFRVADTGTGIAPEFLPKIFDSFTREQDDRISRTEGSGLGMAITKMIVDMMGGTISVKSTPGKGSVFTVAVDFRISAKSAQPLKSLPNLRILLAVADPDTRQITETLLGELGVKADVADSGQAAVKMAAEAHMDNEKYSLILLDEKLPDTDGLQAAEMLRDKIGKRIPILLLTTDDRSSVEHEAQKTGISGLLQKPLFQSTLYHGIRQYVLDQEESTNTQNKSTEFTGRRILIAEDNQLNQEIIKELLESIGIQTEVADTGLACVEKFEQSPIGYLDLILMDIQMPIMNGYEATRRIRSLDRPDAASIPIFAMTADAFSEDIEAAKQAGMNRHLSKPLDLPILLREMQAFMRKKD